MRWSSLFIPTLRDAPAEAEAVSHRLLVRGGFMRQLQSGHYSMLKEPFNILLTEIFFSRRDLSSEMVSSPF